MTLDNVPYIYKLISVKEAIKVVPLWNFAITEYTHIRKSPHSLTKQAALLKYLQFGGLDHSSDAQISLVYFRSAHPAKGSRTCCIFCFGFSHRLSGSYVLLTNEKRTNR